MHYAQNNRLPEGLAQQPEHAAAIHQPMLSGNGGSESPGAPRAVAAASNAPLRCQLDVGHMLCHRPPRLDYVMPGLLASTVGLMVGPGGVSKTMLALQIGIAMATGTPLLGGLVGPVGNTPQQAAPVVLVLAEETALVVWHRLYAIFREQVFPDDREPDNVFGLLVRNLRIYALESGSQVNLLGPNFEPTRAGEDLCKTCDGARLVILDPVRNFHSADENDSTAMSALMRHVAGYAAWTGAAWLLVHHSSRASALGGYGGSADAGRGSTVLTNAARWQLNLSRPSPEAMRRLKLPPDELHNYVLLDIPKANYSPAARTMVLARSATGVLSPAERES